MRWGEVPCGSDTGRWNISSSFQLCDFVLYSGCPHPDFPGSLKARISFLLNCSCVQDQLQIEPKRKSYL